MPGGSSETKKSEMRALGSNPGVLAELRVGLGSGLMSTNEQIDLLAPAPPFYVAALPFHRPGSAQPVGDSE